MISIVFLSMFAIFRTTISAFNVIPTAHQLPGKLFSRSSFPPLSGRVSNTRSIVSSSCRTTSFQSRQIQRTGYRFITSTRLPFDNRRIRNSVLYENQPNGEIDDDDGPHVSISTRNTASTTGTKTKSMKIYVGNISSATTPEVLVKHFRSQYNMLDGNSELSVINASIPSSDHKKGLSRGYGFVILAIEQDMDISVIERNVELLINKTNGNMIDGMPICVNSYVRKGRKAVMDDAKQYSKQQQLQHFEGDAKKTRYTIDDTVCPPTEEKALRKIVMKHVSTNEKYLSCRPLAAHTMEAFEEAQIFVSNFYRENGEKTDIILDSGCGTGRSTLLLGERYPNSIVLGIDRSLSRLQRNFLFREDDQSDENEVVHNDEDDADFELSDSSSVIHKVPALRNVLLIRAELTDFWRCCLNAGWNIRRHYILYPNPYPKMSRLKSRWYAHPSFPIILKLGGDIIIRSNWKGYLDEFQSSVKVCDEFLSQAQSVDVVEDSDSSVDIGSQHGNYARKYSPIDSSRLKELEYHESNIPMTNFEKKYYLCGERTYELEFTDNTLQERQ